MSQHSELLPDCRAYELATPPYKEGNPLRPLAVAEDGSHLLISSFGAFDSTGGDPFDLFSEGAVYVVSRTPSGWTTTPVEPPRSIYQDVLFWDSSSDFTKSLWALGKYSRPHGDVSFYLRRSDGSFVEIGSPTATTGIENALAYNYLGASADLSHVLFEVGSGSLYEYVGVESSTRLPVGVKGGAGSAKLVSECGTRLGSGREEPPLGSFYNAVSASGARIFFTAVRCGTQPPVEELLVREETSPGILQTVPLSEPSLTYCAESPALTCGDAEFEGASQDGSKVFFTSTQALVEGASNDTEGNDSAVGGCVATVSPGGCNLYEYEFLPNGAHRLALASAGSADPQVQGVARISEDGSHVYFVAKGVLTGAQENGRAETASEGAENLYVFEHDALHPTGHTLFIAKLSSADEVDWARADNRPVQASREGRFFVFIGHSDLTHEGVEEGSAQVYEYDAEAERLVRASIGQGGYNNDGKTPNNEGRTSGYKVILSIGPEFEEAAGGLSLPFPYRRKDSPVAATGTLTPNSGAVFFESPTALAPGALNDRGDYFGNPIPNVYEYGEGTVHLISDGRDTSTIHAAPSVHLLGASFTGSDVFFTTSSQLVPSDRDNQQDIYDARVEGGFPEPSPSTGCAGEACQGLLSAPPTLPAPGSTYEAVGMTSTAPVPVAGGAEARANRSKAKHTTRKKAARKKKRRGKAGKAVLGGRKSTGTGR